MLNYLVILLDDSSVSYCHYNNKEQSNLMPMHLLHDGILFAMKNNLKIQYLLPSKGIPEKYVNLMDNMIHDNIGSIDQVKMASVIVLDNHTKLRDLTDLDRSKRYVIRIQISEFINNVSLIEKLYKSHIAANIVFTDIENFCDSDIPLYNNALNKLCDILDTEIASGNLVNTNLITDRIVLDKMNNCGAGETYITLAPNGKFYPCPAFYYDNDADAELGSLYEGIKVQRLRLFGFSCAPLCKRCDAYQCKRCVWLNKRLTYEVNIPSRQQCVISHIERNASARFLGQLQQKGFLLDKEIPKIDYLDPFDIYKDS